jgi:hypothetical protein
MSFEGLNKIKQHKPVRVTYEYMGILSMNDMCP